MTPAESPLPAARHENAGIGAFLVRFFRLAAPFFTSEEKWMAWTLLIGVLALTSVQIGIAIRLNIWNRDFFNALENRDWNAFAYQMGLFALLAGTTMGIAVYQVYVRQLLQLRWRRWLTASLVTRWLENGRHYQLNFIESGVDNPDQRISENTKDATEMAVEFGLGIFDKTITLLSFIGILWAVSGPLDVMLGTVSFRIPGYMVFAALLYAGVGSVLTYYVGRPIVAANRRQTAREADYRFALVRLRENSEAVALIRGEPDEKKVLTNYFGDVLASTIGLMRTQRRLMWLTSFYAAVGMVYPTLVASPRFFAGAITLGVLMQITAAFGQVQTSLNYFVDNFPRIAEWRSHIERLLEFEAVLQTTAEAESETGEPTTILFADSTAEGGAEELRFDDLQIAHTDGSIMIADANSRITKGERVLIVGPSGSGKSTLFRAIAGLWPWGTGTISMPDRSGMMFMPQRPYLPLGTLRTALAYPVAVHDLSVIAVRAALHRCGLDHLIGRLDDCERWDRVLSVGEQQRLAFARLLLHKPEWVFMDEATSALDEDAQKSLMQLFQKELSGTTMISIAHRPGMATFHDRTLTLVLAVGGARLTRKHQPAMPRPFNARHRGVPPKVILRRFRSSRPLADT